MRLLHFWKNSLDQEENRVDPYWRQVVKGAEQSAMRRWGSGGSHGGVWMVPTSLGSSWQATFFILFCFVILGQDLIVKLRLGWILRSPSLPPERWDYRHVPSCLA